MNEQPLTLNMNTMTVSTYLAALESEDMVSYHNGRVAVNGGDTSNGLVDSTIHMTMMDVPKDTMTQCIGACCLWNCGRCGRALSMACAYEI